MIVIPAIDLKGGKCVRLREGKMDDETIFSSNPIEVANSWHAQGAELLHIVDLDGAVNGVPINKSLIKDIVNKNDTLSIQVGGGIRNFETAKEYLDSGVERVVFGTHAVKEPELIRDLCEEFPNQVVLGIDSRYGYVKTDGWLEDSKITPKDLVEIYEGLAISAIIFTDITRDGMMKGLNIHETLSLAAITSIPVIASGGISSLEDIQNLVSASKEGNKIGIDGVICGRSLYEEKFTLKEAMELTEQLI